MLIFLIFVVIVLLIKSAILRYTLSHLPKVCFYAFTDFKKYIKYKRWNEFDGYGRMDIYIADDAKPFGSGKTLNMVSDALSVYNHYNDVEVYDFDSDCWVMQYVHIISNVDLIGVPFIFYAF